MRLFVLLFLLALSMCAADATFKSSGIGNLIEGIRRKFGGSKPGGHKPVPGHPKPWHPKPGHPKPGHPKPGHPKPGHPKPGHPKPGHPKPGHPKPWFPKKCSYCVENAECNKQNCCQCKPGYKGNPYFMCRKPDDYDVCKLCDDPVVTTESWNNAAIHYLGSTLMMDKTVRVYSKKCRIQVVITNERRKGKLYPKCVFVRFDIDNTRSKDCSFAYKICAEVKPDWTISWDIRYGVYTSSGHLHLKPYKIMNSNRPYKCYDQKCNCRVDFKLGSYSLLEMEAKCCKFKMGFRPFLKKLDWLKTGIYLLTPKSGYNNVLPDNLLGYPICLARGVTIPKLQTAIGLTDNRQHAMTHLALTNMPSNHRMVIVNPGQAEMAAALRKCNYHNRKKFYRKFGFILDSPLIIHCISGDGNGLAEMMAFVEHAANWLCADKDGSCDALMTILKTRCKKQVEDDTRFSELAKFIKDGCE